MEREVTLRGAPCAPFLVQPRWKPSLLFPLSTGMRHLIHEAREPFFSFASRSHLWRGVPFHHIHDAIYRSLGLTKLGITSETAPYGASKSLFGKVEG
jgi:hypothetical protein